nr:retrovirus-related Pol polyprotein from transposon TNT 1-94 [Tanacetum cinerariifolium]
MRPFGCLVAILNTLDSLGKFDGKVDEGFLLGYSVSSKAFRVFSSRTRIVQETLHVNFLENKPNFASSGPTWLFDIDSLTRTTNYQPVTAGYQLNPGAGFQDKFDAEKAGEEIDQKYNNDRDAAFDGKEPEFDEKKPESEVNVSSSSSAQSRKQDDMTKKEAKGKSPIESFTGYRDLSVEFKDCSDNSIDKKKSYRYQMGFRNKKDERGIMVRNKARLVAQGHTQEEGIDYEEVFALVARIEAIRLFLAYASFMGFMVYQMDVKSDFLYGTIEKEVYVCQPLGFEDPGHPDKVYKMVKALYGLHQAPIAWYETLAKYLLENGFQRGKIDQTIFIKRQKRDILLVQIYVDDIIFGATNKDLCKSFEKFMKDKFQMSSIGELTFFLGLQVKQKKDGTFISQDKYVAEILRKFGLQEVKSASTPLDTKKPLLKDHDGEDVDVHTY